MFEKKIRGMKSDPVDEKIHKKSLILRRMASLNGQHLANLGEAQKKHPVVCSAVITNYLCRCHSRDPCVLWIVCGASIKRWIGKGGNDDHHCSSMKTSTDLMTYKLLH